jgi:hypothetical protein
MGKRTMWILTVLALVVALLQKTPMAFLLRDAADFVWGLTGGLAIGSIVASIAGRSGE